MAARTKATKAFKVDTSPSKDIVVDGLTRDVSIEACIYDLVDNAIDAARDTAFQNNPDEERTALLASYAGFSISLTINADGIKITDNCGGISVDALKDMVLRFGKPSNHAMGIGVFGVGLNRALFKLGRLSTLSTDTGTQRAVLTLNNDVYLKSDDWQLPAQELPTTRKAGTTIEITRTPEDISHQFADEHWVDELRSEVGRRYSRFLAKGLALTVNGVPVEQAEPSIRENGPYDIQHKFYRTEKGVSVHLRSGQHGTHRFTKEPDYDRALNTSLTPEFGWTIYCNDRAILTNDWTDKTGLDKKHSEYYGFVGTVEFISENPSLLPWSTTKTDVDLNNSAYRRALDDMKKSNEHWRSFSDHRKNSATVLKSIPAKKPTATQKKSAATTSPRREKTPATLESLPPTKKTVISKPDYHQYREILPQDISEHLCTDKHLAVIHEAKNIDLGEITFAGMALIRMLFEFSVINYLHRNGKFEELRIAAIAQRRSKGMKIDAKAEGQIVPSIDEILPYLANNPDVWGAKSSQLKHALSRMSAHGQILNSAIHNPFQPFNRTKAFEIRDEVLPLLRHLIET